ncbi:MAG: 23S rRNA (pseudouridine(1915)-N(3))-methyltransferase RlmH [Pseudomonadota bacterium]
MHVRLLAVGARQPTWVRDAVDTYVQRLPRAWRFEVIEIDAGKGAAATPQRQGQRLLGALGAGERLVTLAEDGRALASAEFAAQLDRWLGDGVDIALAIGGADGLSAEVRGREFFSLSLSAMTLPHALARVLLVEQLYRAHTLLSGHPYHRA